MTVPHVQFKRVLLPADAKGGPTVGDDVIAVKIAVSRMGFWPWGEFDDVMNNRFAHGLKPKARSGLAGFQRSVGIDGTGKYGRPTHSALLKSKVPRGLPHAGESAFDGNALALYGQTQLASYKEKTVNDIFRWWQWLVDRTAEVHYRQYRPVRFEEPPGLPKSFDCSSGFIYCAKLGGALSPDAAYGFSGYGNTDSLVRCGVPIRESQIDEYAREHYVGAFYGRGRWATTHVVAVRSRQRVYSHGREEAPEVHTSVRYRSDLVDLRAFEVA